MLSSLFVCATAFSKHCSSHSFILIILSSVRFWALFNCCILCAIKTIQMSSSFRRCVLVFFSNVTSLWFFFKFYFFYFRIISKAFKLSDCLAVSVVSQQFKSKVRGFIYIVRSHQCIMWSGIVESTDIFRPEKNY